MGNSGSQDILKKRQSTSPSVRRNDQNVDASVDGNLVDDRDSTSIFRKLMGRELYNSLSADIYLHYRVEFTSNAIQTKAPDLVHFVLLAVNTLDESNAFGTPATKVRRPTDGSHWSAPGHVLEKLHRFE